MLLLPLGLFVLIPKIERSTSWKISTRLSRPRNDSEGEYQTTALDAMAPWKQCNGEIKSGRAVPPGLTTEDVLFVSKWQLHHDLRLGPCSVLKEHSQEHEPRGANSHAGHAHERG